MIKKSFFLFLIFILTTSCLSQKEVSDKGKLYSAVQDTIPPSHGIAIDSTTYTGLNDTITLYRDSIISLEEIISKLKLENVGLKDSIELLNGKITQLEEEKFKEFLLEDKTINDGVRFQRLEYKGVAAKVITVDNPKSIKLFHKDNSKNIIGNFNRLKKVVNNKKEELVFVMNAGMYEPNYEPVGLYIENGTQTKKINRIKNKSGNFYLLPNGVFMINSAGNASVISTEQVPNKLDDIKYATQSGPMLLMDNKIHDKFRDGSPNKRIRNGVGVNENGKVIFIITEQAINLYSFASLFKELKCRNALYLDGVVSKAFVTGISKENQASGTLGPMIGVVKMNNKNKN